MQGGWLGNFLGDVSAHSLLGLELHTSPPHSQPRPNHPLLGWGSKGSLSALVNTLTWDFFSLTHAFGVTSEKALPFPRSERFNSVFF